MCVWNFTASAPAFAMASMNACANPRLPSWACAASPTIRQGCPAPTGRGPTRKLGVIVLSSCARLGHAAEQIVIALQLGVAAAAHQASLLQHEDLVGRRHGRKSMCDGHDHHLPPQVLPA